MQSAILVLSFSQRLCLWDMRTSRPCHSYRHLQGLLYPLRRIHSRCATCCLPAILKTLSLSRPRTLGTSAEHAKTRERTIAFHSQLTSPRIPAPANKIASNHNPALHAAQHCVWYIASWILPIKELSSFNVRCSGTSRPVGAWHSPARRGIIYQAPPRPATSHTPALWLIR